jgi:CrcB protein
MPWATLIANVAGASLLGAIATVPVAAGRWGDLRMPLLGIGFCGGLTTFSALGWELFGLLDRGSVAVAVAYATLSLVLGMAALVAARRVVLIRLEEGERA